MMNRLPALPLLATTALLALNVAGAQSRPPIIDIHLHAYTEAQWGGRPPNPATGVPAPASAEEQMRQTLAMMDHPNIAMILDN